MGKHNKPTESPFSLFNIASGIVIVFVAYSAASKVYACSLAEESFVRYAREILEHSACNSERETFELFGMDCEKARKKLSSTEADWRWWSCVFSSVSILQSPTTWLALGVCGYLFTRWLRYVNYMPQQVPQQQQQPQLIYLQQPPTLRIKQKYSDEDDDHSFHSSEEDELEEGYIRLLPAGTRRSTKHKG